MSNHGLTVENLMRILPAVLARDKNVYALAEAIAEALVAELGNIDLVRIYARIDELPEDLLDILAYDFKVDWWDGDYTLEQKRKTLKDSWRVHRMMGTRARGVELAVQAVFSSATVSEWFEYGGKPYYFRLSVDDTNILVTDENHQKLMDRVNWFKSLRSRLEKIEYVSTITLAPSVVGIASGLGYAMTETTLPTLEREFDFSSRLSAGSAQNGQHFRRYSPDARAGDFLCQPCGIRQRHAQRHRDAHRRRDYAIGGMKYELLRRHGHRRRA